MRIATVRICAKTPDVLRLLTRAVLCASHGTATVRERSTSDVFNLRKAAGETAKIKCNDETS